MADLLYSLGASTLLAIPRIAKLYLPIVYPYYTSEHFKHSVSEGASLSSPDTKTIFVIRRVTETATITSTATSVSTETSFVTAFKTTLATITETSVSTTSRVVTYFSNLRAGEGTPRATFPAWCDEATTKSCVPRPTPTSSALIPSENSRFLKNVLLWFLLAVIFFMAVGQMVRPWSVREQRIIEENVKFQRKLGAEIGELQKQLVAKTTEIAILKGEVTEGTDGP